LAAAQREATRCTCGLATIADGEVAVGVGVASAGSDVCWVEDVGVDELDVSADAGQEVLVTLFDVLAPELCALEKLGAFGNFAAEFVSILLFHELDICQ
jgi:hypothetical protein